MATTIRKHLRDFIAVIGLLVIALGISYYILQEQRLRIPVLEEKPFELKAEFETAQAVVPGQGQTIRVAGVRVGDVADVELEDGNGVVTFAIDREYLPVYRDATLLLRPQTGLKDMFFDMDPGTRAAGEFADGDMVPLANTAPDVNLDEILEALDGDTQAYLRTLLVGGGQGTKGRGKELGDVLGSLGPINRDLERLNTEVAKRRRNLSNLVHNLNLVTAEVGDADAEVLRLVETSNSTLGAIASQDPHVQRSVELLGPTLRTATNTFNEVSDFAAVLGPTLNDLRPFARNLDEFNAATRRLAERTTPVIRDEIRPFVRAARRPTDDLRTASRLYSKAAPPLTEVGEKLNRLGNMAAYNPDGANPAGAPERDEGYLYWLAWLTHNGTSIFGTQDGNGLFRRIYFTAGCNNILNFLLDEPATRPLITGLPALFDAGGFCS